MDDELQHYGVKGMKWGIRRDFRALANHRRNREYRKAKNAYDRGDISKAEKKSRYAAARQKKKNYISETRSRYKNASPEQRRKMDREIKNQSVNEIPYRNIKKGATTVNRILGGYGVGAAVVGGVAGAAMFPAMAPMFVGAAVVDSAAAVGWQALRQWGIDRLT